MNVIGDILIVNFDKDLDEKRLLEVQESVLIKLTRREVNGVLLDLSSIRILDLSLANKITNLSKMAELMGAVTIITGIRPEVVASIIMLGFSIENLKTALNVERGIDQLNSILHPIIETEDEVEEENEEGELNEEIEEPDQDQIPSLDERD